MNGPVFYKPACRAGCMLSGDSTTSLWNMTWPVWTRTGAVGTGTEQLDDCTPNCAAGTLHAVRVTVTFSKPVQAGCTAATRKLYWTRASFVWPGGLPAALSGDNAPANPFDFFGTNTCG